MDGFDEYTDYFRRLTGVHDKDFTELEELCQIRYYEKNDLFLKEKDNPIFSGFVLNGAFRDFYTDRKGREYNKLFSFKGDFIGSYYDLAKGEPSTVTIEALTKSKVLVIRHSVFQQLLLIDPFWLKVAFLFTRNLLLKKYEKEYQLLTLSASERYQLLQKEYPELEQLVPAYHIASYLGITPITLSRIKSKLK